ncbi:MAG: N-acetylmuramoyl-L-alanine amidase [Actinomycetia bacterium]|nr:N-acetylmuramoyl-L-alanine amidase [Actinomycetes bacterium]
MALETRKVLETRGHRVGMSRTGDTVVGSGDIQTSHYSESTNSFSFYSDTKTGAYPIPYDDLQARCNKANFFGADLFISIHNNAGGTATGTESYYNDWNTQSDTKLAANLAALLQNEVTTHAGTTYRKVDDVGYYVVRWANMPAALVEVAFLSNSSDRAKLLSATFRHKVAVGIADAVDRFFASKPFKPIEPRIADATRYATSSAAALAGWPTGADAVIVASGEDWADALTASPLSVALDAPVLLTPRASLTASTAAAIAALVAERVGLKPGAGVTVVAGTVFPDATSSSAFSGMLGMPILLTRSDSLPGATAAFLAEHSEDLTRVVVVGGPPVVSTALVGRLRQSRTVIWLYGPDRYQTNVAVLRRFWPTGRMTPVIATAVDFPDALTAGA